MESLGLTGYEIKVYISLLEIGSMTASDISKKSGVPYSKIYEYKATKFFSQITNDCTRGNANAH
jgi:predicted transcriptional regulator